MYARPTEPYLVASRCDTMKKQRENMRKTTFKTLKIGLTLVAIYPCIPVIPRYGYAVCRGVPKSNTVPVPAEPVLEAPRVNPYPCESLVSGSDG